MSDLVDSIRRWLRRTRERDELMTLILCWSLSAVTVTLYCWTYIDYVRANPFRPPYLGLFAPLYLFVLFALELWHLIKSFGIVFWQHGALWCFLSAGILSCAVFPTWVADLCNVTLKIIRRPYAPDTDISEQTT